MRLANRFRHGGRAGLLVATALAVGALAGCGGSSSSNGPGTAGTSAKSTMSSSAGCSKSGGTLVVGTEDAPVTLFAFDPRRTLGTLQVSHALHSLLVEVDNDFEVVPGLADSWDVSADKRTYTFRLNPDAKWSDGRPVTSADVAFSFDLWKKAKTNSFMGRIASTRTRGPRTFVVKLKRPFPTLLLNLGNNDNVIEIQPKHVLQGEKDLAKTSQSAKPVGSGPWLLDSWAKGDSIKLKRNPSYYRKGKPCLDSLVFKYLPDANARKIAFESGEVDLLIPYSIALNNLDAYRRDARYQVVEGGLGTAPTDALIFNMKTKPLADVRVRRAIAHAIDRNAYNNLAYFGQGKVAHSSVNSTLTDYYDGSFDAYAKQDVDQAKRLLDEAGFKADGSGKRLSLTLRYPASRPYQVSGAAVIKSQLAKVGISVELRPGDQTSVNDTVFVKHDFDLSLQLRTTGPDPSVFFPLLFGKQGIGGVGFNGGSYTNPALEAAFERLSTAADAAEIKAIWKDIQRLTMEDLPRLPLVEYPNLTLAQAGYESPVVGALSYFGQYTTTSLRR